MDKNHIALTQDQIKQLGILWFIYGNNGEKSTKGNHSYIQGFLENGEDRRQFYLDGIENMKKRSICLDTIRQMAITDECIKKVEEIVYKKRGAK